MPNPGTFVKEGEVPKDLGADLGAALLAACLGLALASGVFQTAWARWPAAGLLPDDRTLVLLAACLGLLLLVWRMGLWRRWTRPAFVLGWTQVAFAVLALTIMFSQHSAWINGHWTAWLADDPMVSMQYARHLVEGKGLVWTQGQRVEGFSNPLWVLCMAGILAIGVPRAAAAAGVLFLNLLLGLAALPACARLARALGASPLAAALAAAGLGLSYEWVWAASSGMESTALACLCAWAFVGLAEAQTKGRDVPAWVPILAGAASVLRFDGFIPAGLIWAMSWRLPSRRGRWWDAMWVLGPAIAWQIFRLAYYHAWIPNTVILKMGDWPGRWQAGWDYVMRLDFQSRIALLAALSALCLRNLRLWALLFLAALCYGLTTAGDFYPGTRYLAWAWPLLWTLSAAAFCVWLPRPWSTLCVAIAAVCAYQAFCAFPGLMQGGWLAGKERIEIAATLDRLVAPGQVVASDWAGSFYFYSNVAGEDLLGKCDPVVAHVEPDPSLGPTAHNKLDLAYSLEGLRPDWVLLVAPGQEEDLGWLHSVYDARIWDDPGFSAHCKANLRRVGVHWALCRCRW
ncbi:MAG: hypothetical protein ACREKE_04170 [bacterium]